MQTQQRHFLNVIGMSTERAFRVHNIKPKESFLSTPASIAKNITTTSWCRVPTPHSTKTRSCRRATASFAMGTSINARTQDESKRPWQHIKSRSKPQKKTENQTAHYINNNGNLRYPNPIIYPVAALCIQSQKYQWPKNTPHRNAKSLVKFP